MSSRVPKMCHRATKYDPWLPVGESYRVTAFTLYGRNFEIRVHPRLGRARGIDKYVYKLFNRSLLYTAMKPQPLHEIPAERLVRVNTRRVPTTHDTPTYQYYVDVAKYFYSIFTTKRRTKRCVQRGCYGKMYIPTKVRI